MILNYKEYFNSIKEGLINTYDINKHKSNIFMHLNSYGIEHQIKIYDKYRYEIILNNPKQLLENDVFELLIQQSNLLGYYPSYIFFVNKSEMERGMIFIAKSGEDIFNNFYDEILKDKNLSEDRTHEKKKIFNNIKEIRIRFESKYEEGLYKNTLSVPDKAYHLSPSIRKEKILKFGLCPKSNNRVSYHIDKIHLFYNLEDYNNILKKLKRNDIINNKNYDYTLYEVDLSKKETDSGEFIIHTDPNCINVGFVLYDNIDQHRLKVLNDNL